MKSKSLAWIAAVIGMVLLVASAVSQGFNLRNDKLSLESRVTALESKVSSLENEIAEMNRQMAHPPVKIVPCK